MGAVGASNLRCDWNMQTQCSAHDPDDLFSARRACCKAVSEIRCMIPLVVLLAAPAPDRDNPLISANLASNTKHPALSHSLGPHVCIFGFKAAVPRGPLRHALLPLSAQYVFHPCSKSSILSNNDNGSNHFRYNLHRLWEVSSIALLPHTRLS